MKNNKIDIIVKYFYPVAAGIETNILETYSVLAQNGWDVTVHTTNNTLTEEKVLKSKETIRGIKIKRYNWLALGYLPKIDYKNTDIIALHNFNILPHFYILFNSLFFKLLGRKKYKLVLTPHGGFSPEWSVFPKLQALAKIILHYSLGIILVNLAVDAIRVVSVWEKLEMLDKGIKKSIINIIPNGIEEEAFMDVDKLASKKIKRKVKNYGKYLIQIGRIYPIKNYETVIKSLPLINNDINFVIVGPIHEDEEYKNYLINLAKSLGVENRVKFAGVVRGVDKYYLIKNSLLMVHMSIWESFCNVVHEGLSQGKICLVANNTALLHLIKDGKNGYLVPTYDHKLLARKIEYVLENIKSKKHKEMSRKNKQTTQKNSWRTVADNMNDLYISLCEEINKNWSLRMTQS